MIIKWVELYKDLKGVLKKHFLPPKPEADGPAIGLIKMIERLQKQQKDLNDMRTSVGDLVGMLKDDAVLRELHQLEAMAPKDEAFDKKDFDGHDDSMFG